MSDESKPVPPGTPPPSPPPGGPKGPTPVAPPKFGDDLLAVADAAGVVTPARRDAMGAGSAIPPVAVKETGGPVRTTRTSPGEEPTPGSAVAICRAARESTDAVVALSAGANVPGVLGRDEGRVDGAVGAATFTLPPTPEPPHFALRPGGLIYRGHDKT